MCAGRERSSLPSLRCLPSPCQSSWAR
jgi:hypothetical protein